MRFGNFMAPFYPVGQNPTLALERDLDLIVAMDRLGFDEAWIGEHHSAGFEIIASPEVVIGVAAARTSSGRAWNSASTRSCDCCAARPSPCTPTGSRCRMRGCS